MADGHLQFEAFLNGEAVAPPVLPVLGDFAATVAHVTPAEMWQDSMRLASAVEDAQALTGAPALCAGFDIALTAAALGCQITESDEGRREVALTSAPPEVLSADVPTRGRVPVVLGMYERLKVTLRNISFVAPLPGVATVTRQLMQAGMPEDAARSQAASATRALVRAFLDEGVQHVLLAEEALTDEEVQAVQAVYRSISNVVHFFKGKLFLLVREAPSGIASVLSADICLGAATEDAGDLPCGGGLPVEVLRMGKLPREEASAWLLGPGRRFLATDWEVPAETPPEVVLNISSLAEEIAR